MGPKLPCLLGAHVPKVAAPSVRSHRCLERSSNFVCLSYSQASSSRAQRCPTVMLDYFFFLFFLQCHLGPMTGRHLLNGVECFCFYFCLVSCCYLLIFP